MIPGIVLAAGASSRMGRPKALLQAAGMTFVRRILRALRDGGVSSAIVVVRPGSPQLIEEIGRAGFGRAIENPRADEGGQLSSLLVGINAVDAPDVRGALVTLVDVPLITSATIRTLLDRAAASSAPVLRAVHHGRHGHPVVFKREVFDALRMADPAIGAKAVMHSLEVEDVEVDDAGVTRDVDTPEDYEELQH
jgi:molybdenum cofactor cytidylyltransferase